MSHSPALSVPSVGLMLGALIGVLFLRRPFPAAAAAPKVHDERLQLTLFAGGLNQAMNFAFTTEGVTRHFNGSKVKGFGASKRSLMPDGLENALTVHEFRDLVAFLESLK
ncbi:MAG: hypothetical protein ACKVJX_18915 [Verrucomicrobiia bacterium]|jgi:hypothetical protein